MIVCGYLIIGLGQEAVGRGVFSYFIGGMAYQAFDFIAHRKLPLSGLVGLVFGVLAMWILLPANLHGNILYEQYLNTAT